MKKLVYACSFALISLGAFSQPLANHLYLGGSLGFSTTSTEFNDGGTTGSGNDQTSFTFSPAIGYTLTDNWLVGLRVGLGRSTTENVNESGEFNVQLFGRYNIPITERFYFFPEMIVGFGNSYTDNFVGNTEVRVRESDFFQVGVGPGFAFFPSTHWSMELSAGFFGFTSITTNDPTSDPQPDEITTNTFGLSLNAASVNVGVAYYFML